MSANFPIKPESLSFSAIKTDLETWITNQPDNEQWSLFFDGSTGQHIIELIAGMYAIAKFDNIVARREAYIQFSKNRSSKIGSAQFLGYSTYRGQNAIVSVTIVPSGTGVWEEGEVIGSVSDKDLIVTSPTIHNAGVPVTLECVVGTVLEQELTSNTEGLNAFRFTEGSVSEHARIFIDDHEVTSTPDVSGMLNGEFQLQSNSFGSVDAKYLNLTSFIRRYGVGSVIKLQWVELYNLDFSLPDVTIDELEGILEDAFIVSLFKEEETKDSIAINAPLHSETKMNVRGKRDQAKVLRQLDDNIISAEGVTVGNGIMELFYVLEDDERYSPAQVKQLVEDFEPYRPHGLLPPIISSGRRARRIFTFKVKRQPNTTGDIIAKIGEVMSAYEYKLGGAIDLYDVESALEGEDFIKIARLSLTANSRESGYPYEVGDMIKLNPDNGKVYEAIKHAVRSGGTIPTWPIITSATVDDGGVIWQAFIKSDVSEMPHWTPNTDYSLYSRVRPVTPNEFAYRVIGFINRSSDVEPDWPTEIGETIADGDILWRCKELVGTNGEWASLEKYEVGNVVVPSEIGDKMFQAYSNVKLSGDVAPEFPTEIEAVVVDGAIHWECKDPFETEQELNEDQYYVITNEVTVS